MEILKDCESLNDVARKLFGKACYSNREKVKKFLFKNGINWQEWLENIKARKAKYCIVCGKKLEKDQKKFCSHSCSAIHNNHLKVKKVKKCEYCGKPLKGREEKFCSTKCQQNLKYEEYIERWKRGEETGLKGEYGVSKYIRRFLVEKHSCRCEKCGWNAVNIFTGKVPLEVHHIDGDYTNNKEENLQLLCPNCHSLTETYKAHNKNGRKGRKKYTEQ